MYFPEGNIFLNTLAIEHLSLHHTIRRYRLIVISVDC